MNKKKKNGQFSTHFYHLVI